MKVTLRAGLATCTSGARRRAALIGVAVLAAAGLAVAVTQNAGALPQPSIPSVQAKINGLTTQFNQANQDYDNAAQQLSAAKSRLRTVDKQLASEEATYRAARQKVVVIANSEYEDSAQTSLAGLLTAADPAQVLAEASIVTQLTNSRSQETATFLADAVELGNVQQEQQRTEQGIAQLAAETSHTKNHILTLLDDQKSILNSLTAQQQTQVNTGTSNGGGGTTSGHYTGPTGTQADAAVAFEFAQLGCPYVYGATGPCDQGFDCSGLAMSAWASAGVAIPRDTYEQWAALPHIPVADIKPGDLLYYNAIGHVAMYVGGGMIIDAPEPGEVVRELPMDTDWYAQTLAGAAVPSVRARWQKPPSYRARTYGHLPGGRPPVPPDVPLRGTTFEALYPDALSTLAGTMRRTLIVTNDFPPRQGGIQSFVHELALRLDPGDLTVYAPKWDGAAEFDARQPFEVVRHPTSLMIGGPSVTRRAAELVRSRQAEVVIFGAAAPLGLITPALRRAGIERAIAITHGHEAGWAALPVARDLLRRIGERTDVVTYLGEYFRVRLARALTPAAAARLTQLHPGVDATTFKPDPVARAAIRERYRLADRPVVVCVSRLVRRKGQDTLLRAWPAVVSQIPDAALLIVGAGPYGASLRQLAQRSGVDASVHFTGPVPQAELPAHYAAGDVFSMPCRTRRGGLDVEGLGIVYLEASAAGLPVVGGDSGGAPDAILEGETGYVVGGSDVAALSARLIALLSDPPVARAMGEKGRAWVERDWSWDQTAARLRALINP